MTWDGFVESFLGLALSIGEYISQGVYAIVVCVFYPVQVFFYWQSSILGVVGNALVDLVASFYALNTVLVNHLSSTVVSVLPGVWGTIILTGLAIVFTLRLYYFVKDVSIFGFKI